MERILSRDAPHPALPDLNGILAVDKPFGITSHDVVSRIRRIVSMKRVGHGGTLDPFATGVLIVAVGRATRVLQYVQNSDKAYRAHIVLGVDTASHDVEGTITGRTAVNQWPKIEDIEQTVSAFVGTIDQVPPAFSAIKIDGRKLYDRARAGECFDVPVRQVTVHSIRVLGHIPPDLHILVHCSKGTYIRSIARDLGSALGTGGYCHGLVRVSNGPYCLGDCWSLDELAGMDVRAEWPVVGMHPDTALQHLAAVILDEHGTASWYHGRSVRISMLEACGTGDLLRVYAIGGQFLGIGTVDAPDVIRPTMVMPSIDEDEAQ
jgi:tRNA pseudouridine55 synthase